MLKKVIYIIGYPVVTAFFKVLCSFNRPRYRVELDGRFCGWAYGPRPKKPIAIAAATFAIITAGIIAI